MPNATAEGTPPKGSKSRRKPSVLLERLNYCRNTLRSERLSNLAHGMSMPLPDQDRAVHIIQSETLHDWLGTPTSSVLLINGNGHGSNGLRSAVSFVSAKLADALEEVGKTIDSPIINLYFFCGEHANWRDGPDNGLTGLMMSLLGQLLTQSEFDLSVIKNPSKLHTADIEQLSRGFRKLIKQLGPESMVFCIVDSVSFYQGDSVDECDSLLNNLIGLERRKKGRGDCVFKLLLTAPILLRSPAVEALDEDEEVCGLRSGCRGREGLMI
jgi:hypothetical protein